MTSKERSATTALPPAGAVVAVIVVVSALSLISAGAFARFDPAGFAAFTGWENHIHFLHDAGVFQIGIGLMMLAGFGARDALTLGLGGFLFVNTFHALNHALDHHLGGSHLATWFLLGLSVLAAIGLWMRVWRLRRSGVSALRTPSRKEEKA
ncbi:MAG: hypothetical protein ACTH2U_12155 [Brevibacterium sp.]